MASAIGALAGSRSALQLLLREAFTRPQLLALAAGAEARDLLHLVALALALTLVVLQEEKTKE